jgi:titin
VIYSEPQVIGTVVTDRFGSFRTSVSVPTDLVAGEHTFVASGVDPHGHTFSRAMTVSVAAAVAPVPTAAPPIRHPLPVTGPQAASLALAGLLLVGAGVALLLVRRRRRVVPAGPETPAPGE